MKAVFRILMMFGPMIYRQYQKFQSNKRRKQALQYQENEYGTEGRDDMQQVYRD